MKWSVLVQLREFKEIITLVGLKMAAGDSGGRCVADQLLLLLAPGFWCPLEHFRILVIKTELASR